MHVGDIFAANKRSFSFEFFPPKTPAGSEKLFSALSRLETLQPSFVSVTYGAGGGTRDRTHDLVLRIKNETQLDPIPHLTCVRQSRDELEEVLLRYAEAGVDNIMALRGDPPQGEAHDPASEDFPQAVDLVAYIREFNRRGMHPNPRGFGIGVAGFPEGHPATPNRLLEMRYLKDKVDAGADYICTQLFFDNRDFYDFTERCRLAGITVPIVAGIMPILNQRSFERTPELALGARYPAGFLKGMQRCTNDAEIAAFGMEWAVRQCYDLLAHDVEGIHFYTLNHSPVTIEIFRRLGLSSSFATELADT